MGNEGGAVPSRSCHPWASDTWPQGRGASARSAHRCSALHPSSRLGRRLAAPAARGAASASQGGPRLGSGGRSQRSAGGHHAGSRAIPPRG
eukprot:10257105-Alexandrium_andersonii.AAC.1